MADAIQARLDAEAVMHDGYVAAYDAYLERAEKDPAWAQKNRFITKSIVLETSFKSLLTETRNRRDNGEASSLYKNGRGSSHRIQES